MGKNGVQSGRGRRRSRLPTRRGAVRGPGRGRALAAAAAAVAAAVACLPVSEQGVLPRPGRPREPVPADADGATACEAGEALCLGRAAGESLIPPSHGSKGRVERRDATAGAGRVFLPRPRRATPP